MDGNATAQPAAGQEPLPYVVTTDYVSISKYLNHCPDAGTLTAWSETIQHWVLLQTRCKRWSCPHCGPRRIASLTHRVTQAKPNKLVTLTVKTDQYDNPREAYDSTRRAISKLTAKIRKAIGEWEYCRILELTKKGWPHYHLIVRGGYVDQAWLATQWRALTGAYIVDVRQIKGAEKTTKYVMKYLYKQKSVAWTNRRVSWTRRFFMPDDSPKPESLHLLEPEITGDHPTYYAFYELQGATLTEHGADMWIINK